MKRILVPFFLLIVYSCNVAAQEVIDPHKGTIKVQKKNPIYAVFFDNVNNRLVAKDSYGNILDSAVVAFSVFVTVKGVAYQEDVVGNALPKNIAFVISRVDRETNMFFDKIQVKEKDGSIIDWPKFSVTFGRRYEREE